MIGDTRPLSVSLFWLVVLLTFASATSAQAESLWDHNGSVVYLEANGASRKFFYKVPRHGLPVKPGTLLFRGAKHGNSYSGTAFVFSNDCGAIGYPVAGTVSEDDRTVTMWGKAPRRGHGCRVTGYVDDVLMFTFLGPPDEPQAAGETQIQYEELPAEIRHYVEDIRKRCRELWAPNRARTLMQGIRVVDLDGDGARDLMIDAEHLCTGWAKGANCSNRGCDLKIWKQVGRASWKKIFDEHLYQKVISIGSNGRLQKMTVSVSANAPYCDPDPAKSYYSGQSCERTVHYRNNHWVWEKVADGSAPDYTAATNSSSSPAEARFAGTWVSEKGYPLSCAGDWNITYATDGTWMELYSSGTWHMQGDQLIEVVREVGEGEDSAEIGKRRVSKIVWDGPDRVISTSSDGVSTALRRCRR